MRGLRLYRTLRGQIPVPEFAKSVYSVPLCCADSGATCKIYRHFKPLAGGDSRFASELSLSNALELAMLECTRPGGGDNRYIEGLFSICRALALILISTTVNCV